MASRQCPFCGHLIPENAETCFKCREAIPLDHAGGRRRNPAAGYYEIRRGLLSMLLAAVIYYFASGTSGYEFAIPFPSILAQVLLPLLFLCGAGLFFYGVVLKVRG